MARPIDPSKFIARGKPISRRILVGGTLQSGWVVGPFIAAALTAALGVLLYFRTDIPYSIALVPLALVIATPGAVAAAIQLARRRWIEVTADGFIVIRRDGTRRAYDDEQIVGITQQVWNRSDGSFLRRVVIDVTADDAGDSIDCFYHVEAGNEDPLHSLIDRNVRGLGQRTTDGLERGARLSGVGWHYDRDGLHVHHGPARGTYPADGLTYVAFFDRQIKVYRGADVEPLFCVPDGSRNAHALGMLLWGPMEKRPTVNDPLPGQPLGRRMHTIRGRDGWFGGVLALVFGPATAAFIGFGLVQEQTVMLVLGVMSASLAGMGVWLLWRASYMRIDYHQFGVAQPGRGRSLLFEDVGTMRWTANDIRLGPRDGAAGRPIAFHTTSLDYNHDRAAIRDWISTVMARRWWGELADGPVRWTASLRFLPDKLEYLPAGIFGKGDPVAVPYGITSYYLIQTWMELFVQGEPRAVLKQPINATNFWPGLMLLNLIYESLKQQAAEGQGAPAPKFSRPAAKPDERFTSEGGAYTPQQ